MSLKQECVDMINLITKSLQKDDPCNYYDLEVDSIRDLCEKTGEDVTYSECYGCDLYDETCPYKLHNVKVDVAFWDGAEHQYNYMFGNTSMKYKGIRQIKNRKQLMDEMFILKDELEKYKNWKAEFGERYKEYLVYAKQFAQEMKEKYLFFGMVQPEILPMIFHTDYEYNKRKNNYIAMGNLQYVNKQNVINVFCCMKNTEETKRTIRHEVLHYMLYISGLKHADDTAIFHYLCGEYDAHAYMEMNSAEQALYDQLINGIDAWKEVVEQNKIFEDAYENARISLLLAVSVDEDNSLYGAVCREGKKMLQVLQDYNQIKMAS